MTNNDGEKSPKNSAYPHCSGGMCGPLPDLDYYLNRLKDFVEPDDSERFLKLINEAEEKMYKHQLEAGLSAYEQAYELARGSTELGQDECFAVMYHLHYFSFDDRAYRMCVEMTQLALEERDTDILRDIWRMLPEIGVPGGDLHETALELRDGIENAHPEVMIYEKSKRY